MTQTLNERIEEVNRILNYEREDIQRADDLARITYAKQDIQYIKELIRDMQARIGELEKAKEKERRLNPLGLIIASRHNIEKDNNEYIIFAPQYKGTRYEIHRGNFSTEGIINKIEAQQREEG